MKIRIRGNSIRLRLKQGEVDLLVTGESIVEKTQFPGAMLVYRLDVSTENGFSASLENNIIAIRVPISIISNWANTDKVSMYAEEKVSGTDSLSLLIEKDFTCLAPGHHRDCEDDVDTFPHPDA